MAQKGTRKGETALIMALASGQNVRDAAKAVGIGERTARRRMNDEGFRRELSIARDRIISEAVGRLTAASTNAVCTLEQLMSEAESETVRLSAARTILDKTVSMRENLELAERLARVEQILESREDES